jgi:hypothetical protein
MIEAPEVPLRSDKSLQQSIGSIEVDSDVIASQGGQEDPHSHLVLDRIAVNADRLVPFHEYK